MQLPDKKFTGYGTSEQDIVLKYFFIVPDHFDVDNISKRDYHDIEESVNFNTYWSVDFDAPSNSFIQSNLQQIQPNLFKGYLDSDPEFIISKNTFPTIKIDTEDIKTEIKFGYNISKQEIQNLEFYLPLQLKFIKDKIGFIPEQLFISEKFRAKKTFSGITILNFGNSGLNYFRMLKIPT